MNSAWLPHHQTQATIVIASFVSNILHFQSTNETVFSISCHLTLQTILDTWKYIDARFGQVGMVAHHVQQVLYSELSRLPWRLMTSFDNNVLLRMMEVVKPVNMTLNLNNLFRLFN